MLPLDRIVALPQVEARLRLVSEPLTKSASAMAFGPSGVEMFPGKKGREQDTSKPRYERRVEQKTLTVSCLKVRQFEV